MILADWLVDVSYSWDAFDHDDHVSIGISTFQYVSHPFPMFSFQSRQSQLIHFMEDIKLRRENASGDEPELPELQVLKTRQSKSKCSK